MELPEPFLSRMQTQLGGEYAAYLRVMDAQPTRALWVNELKIAPEAFMALDAFPLTPVAGQEGCYAFPNEVAIGRHPVYLAGLLYVQEPSAQRPVSLLDVEPGMTVLDLCAAPGGKSGQIAQRLKGKGLLVANEVSAARATALEFNLERLGVKNALITNLQPAVLCRALAGKCHRVLVDAPCSGEGMFRKEPSAVADWSIAHVRACAARQQEILNAAAQAVRPGGKLVYSTCTFSPEENEETVAAFSREHPAFTLTKMERLYPHTSQGEGQFMAVFTHNGHEEKPLPTDGGHSQRARQGKESKDAGLGPWAEFCSQYLTRTPEGIPTLLPDGRVFLQPRAGEGVLTGLRVRRAGVLAGEITKGRFVPGHGLFLSLATKDTTERVDLEGDDLAAFLSGHTVPCPKTLSGWCAVGYKGYNLGFGKAVQGVLKNHLPKGLRLSGQ